jgi:hypothetical protein
MSDLLYLAILAAFGALSWALIELCQRLAGGGR